MDVSPPRRREKKEKTKRGTLDTPGQEPSPRKEKSHRPKKDVSERPAGYGTMRALTKEEKERELKELRAFAPLTMKPATTDATPAPASPAPAHAALALDEVRYIAPAPPHIVII